LLGLASSAHAETLTLVLPKDTLYQITSDSEYKKTEKIRAAVEAANQRLAGFRIERQADDITIFAALWIDGGKAEFALYGKKPDFYRMAMGVNLEETLKEITRGDARISPVGIEKTKDAIVLKLGYGKDAAPKPPQTGASAPVPTIVAPAAAKQPVPQSVGKAQASSPETAKPVAPSESDIKAPAPPPAPSPAELKARQALEAAAAAAKAKQAEEAAAAAKAKQAEEAAAAAKAKQAEEAAAKAKLVEEAAAAKRAQLVEMAYIGALESRDPKKLLAFAETYPDSPRAATTRDLAQRIKEDAAFKQALKEDTIPAYEEFLKAYPQTARKDEISGRIEQARSRQATRAEDDRKKDAAKKLAADFASAKREGTAALERFAADYPDSPEAKAALDLVAQARDDQAFSRSKGSQEALKNYLADFPKGRHIGEAQRLLADIDKKAAEEAAAPSGTSLFAVATSAPPTIDGKSEDAVWASAPPFVVQLSGGKGASSVELRAVHFQNRIYILAKWKDPTQDFPYRPWRWDAPKKTYQQSATLDDAFSVAIHSGNAQDDACMESGQPDRIDIWLWRAFWSNLSGLASDQMITISKDRLPRANPYMTRSGKGQVWIQNVPDKGEPGWIYDIPLPSPSPAASVPSYKANRASGSAADVAARGLYRNGVWTVEFARSFDTGNDDDVAILPRNGAWLSFAVFDKSDKENHTSSGLVRLEIQGR
jgi:hypothetical protein